MLAQALIEAYDLEETIQTLRQEPLIPTFLDKKQRFKYNDNLEIPRIQHSHANYSFIFRKRKIIFLIRDLRDTLVSHYRIAQPRLNLPEDFGGFIRGNTIDRRMHHDLESRIKLLNSWAEGLKKTYDYKIVRYESLRANPEKELTSILSFIGSRPLSDQQLQNAVDVGSIGNMQKLETTNTATTTRKVSGNPSRYQEYFQESDKDFFQEKVKQDLVCWFDYNYDEW